MAVEMAFIFTFTIHICHLFEGIEHALNDLLVGVINVCPYLEIVGANELGFNLANIDREVFNKMCHALALFAGKFGLFNPSDLVILRTAEHWRLQR